MILSENSKELLRILNSKLFNGSIYTYPLSNDPHQKDIIEACYELKNNGIVKSELLENAVLAFSLFQIKRH